MHFELASVQFIGGGSMSDANPPSLVPGAQYAQLFPEPVILPDDMEHIRERHTSIPRKKAGQFNPEYWSEEAIRDLVARAWAQAGPKDVGPGKDQGPDATAIIAFDSFHTDLRTGASRPYDIGRSGTGFHAPSVSTNTFVVVIRSNMTVKTCYPINPLDRENPRGTYDENTGDERN
jgi:hypothetical protein